MGIAGRTGFEIGKLGGHRLAEDQRPQRLELGDAGGLGTEELLGRPTHGLEVLRMALISNNYDDVLTQA